MRVGGGGQLPEKGLPSSRMVLVCPVGSGGGREVTGSWGRRDEKEGDEGCGEEIQSWGGGEGIKGGGGGKEMQTCLVRERLGRGERHHGRGIETGDAGVGEGEES